MLKLWMKPAGSWRCQCAIASQGGLADGTGAMRKEVAGATGLEPATSAVTGQRSNQLSYAPAGVREGLNAAFRQVKIPTQAFVSTAGPDLAADLLAARKGPDAFPIVAFGAVDRE